MKKQKLRSLGFWEINGFWNLVARVRNLNMKKTVWNIWCGQTIIKYAHLF